MRGDDAHEGRDARASGGERWRELCASFDAAVRACVEPPTAQVGDGRGRDAMVPPRARRRRFARAAHAMTWTRMGTDVANVWVCA